MTRGPMTNGQPIEMKNRVSLSTCASPIVDGAAAMPSPMAPASASASAKCDDQERVAIGPRMKDATNTGPRYAIQ